jgi:hypothetical protein
VKDGEYYLPRVLPMAHFSTGCFTRRRGFASSRLALSTANYRIGRKRRAVTWSNNVIEGNGRPVFKGDFEFAMDKREIEPFLLG